MQRADQVVMLLPRLVVEQNAFLQGILYHIERDLGSHPLPGSLLGQSRRNLQSVIGISSVATGVARYLDEHLVSGFDRYLAQPPLFVGQSTPQKGHNLLFGERLQNVHAAAGEKSRNYFKRGVLCGCTDKTYAALLHIGEEGVLLRLVEAVNFIDKYYRASPVLASAFRIKHDLLDFLNARQHGGEFNELRLGHSGDDLRQCCLSRSWRTPKNQRAGIVTLHLRAQRLARPHQVLLSHKFI